MRFKTLKTIGLRLVAAACALGAAPQEGAGEPILWPDQPPALGLLQTRPVFSLGVARHVEGLIVQHEHLTGERIMLVIHPWSGVQPASGAQQLVETLSDRWRLDTTRRGAAALLTLQETTPGKLDIGYRSGVGLAKPQVASEDDLEKLQEKVNESSTAGSWDSLAEATSTWMLQRLASPLLERPEVLAFPTRAEEWARPQPAPSSAPKKPGTGWLPLAGLGLTGLLAIAMGLVVEAIRRGIKPEVLLGAHRVIRFTLVDHSLKILGKLRRSSRNESDTELQIESLGGGM